MQVRIDNAHIWFNSGKDSALYILFTNNLFMPHMVEL